MQSYFTRLGLFSIFTLFLIQACTKDAGKLPVAPKLNCDTINYTQDIAPIIAKNCSLSGCHVPPNPTGPGVLLDTYVRLVDKASLGRIQARVIDENPTRMPPAGITADEKQLIECWLNNGYKY